MLDKALAVEEPRSFLRAFSITNVVLLTPLLLSVLFFLRSGENWDYSDLVMFQRGRDAVFSPAASFDYFEYKLEMIRQIKPAVVVLGSSRGLGFQGRYFKTPFVNAGMAMRTLEEGELFAEKLLEMHKPRHLIVTVDFWWFNRAVMPGGMSYGRFPRQMLTRDLALLPLDSVWKGKLVAWQLPAVALFAKRSNRLTQYENLGIAGIATSNGIRADGSMLYAEYALGGRSDLDPRFTRTASMIKAGSSNYAWSRHLDRALFDRFARIVAKYQQNGTSVSLMLPPVAPAVGAMLRDREHFGYIDELRRKLHELDVPLADFHDAVGIPATDCEFIDGYHSGDITYLKMLASMAHAWSWLTPLVDVGATGRAVAAFDGNIIDQTVSNRFRGLPEVDFMGLGCLRRPSPIGDYAM